MASSASATIGRPSFRKLFQMPETESSSPISEPVNPHDRNISTTTPIEITPPPGMMLEMVVPVWLFTAACHMVSPGMAACICHQYVKRLKTMAPDTARTCIGLSPVSVFQTVE